MNNSRQVGTNTDKIVPISKELNKMSELDQKEQTEKFDMRLSKWKKLSTRVYFANRQTVLKQYSNFKSFFTEIPLAMLFTIEELKKKNQKLYPVALGCVFGPFLSVKEPLNYLDTIVIFRIF